MAWYDRILNPAWHKISNLESQESFELSFMLLLNGFLRVMIHEELVVPFEKLGDPRIPAKISEGSFGSIIREVQKSCPLSLELRERLIDEGVIGFFSCSVGTPVKSFHLEVFNPEVFIEGAGTLALAEINHRLGRKEPTLPNKAGFSQDSDECRVQVILSWMRLASIRDARFPSFLSNLYFEDGWKKCLYKDDLLKGMATAVDRIGREGVLMRARQECRQLSPQSSVIISYICEKIVANRGRKRGGENLNSGELSSGRQMDLGALTASVDAASVSRRSEPSPAPQRLKETAELMRKTPAGQSVSKMLEARETRVEVQYQNIFLLIRDFWATGAPMSGRPSIGERYQQVFLDIHNFFNAGLRLNLDASTQALSAATARVVASELAFMFVLLVIRVSLRITDQEEAERKLRVEALRTLLEANRQENAAFGARSVPDTDGVSYEEHAMRLLESLVQEAVNRLAMSSQYPIDSLLANHPFLNGREPASRERFYGQLARRVLVRFSR